MPEFLDANGYSTTEWPYLTILVHQKMNRRASTSGVCDRCHGFVSPSSTGVLVCACTDALLDQFISESYQDQKLVAKMLFLHRTSNDHSFPMGKRQEHTRELMELHRTNEQLAIRNQVPSPYPEV